MVNPRDVVRWILRNSKAIAVSIAGAALVLAGLVMLVLPGPGLVVIIAGLAVLATQYAWAERALEHAKQRARQAGDTAKRAFFRRRRDTGTRPERGGEED